MTFFEKLFLDNKSDFSIHSINASTINAVIDAQALKTLEDI